MDKTTLNIGFIGCGNMASAMALYLDASPDYRGNISLYDIDSAKPKALRAELGQAAVCPAAEELINQSDLIIIAVKPQNMSDLYTQIKGNVTGKIVLSIAAGITLEALRQGIGGANHFLRCMPNTPMQLGLGACALCADDNVPPEVVTAAAFLLEQLGVVCVVSEAQIDAVTGLSGSGPAYVFEVIRGLVEGGTAEGLSREDATQLAAQTVKGAAQMVLDGGDPHDLRVKVSSPGGTTVEGLAVLGQGRLVETLQNAVAAAAEKSRDLGR